jgi:hypothetical protein
MAIRVAADAELYRNLKPQQASRALNALRDIGVTERARQGRWYIVDPLLRRYLASRRVEPLSFVRAALDVVEVSDHANVTIEPTGHGESDESGSAQDPTAGQ